MGQLFVLRCLDIYLGQQKEWLMVWSDLQHLPLALVPCEAPLASSRAYIRVKVGALGRLRPQLEYIGQGGKT